MRKLFLFKGKDFLDIIFLFFSSSPIICSDKELSVLFVCVLLIFSLLSIDSLFGFETFLSRSYVLWVYFGLTSLLILFI